MIVPRYYPLGLFLLRNVRISYGTQESLTTEKRIEFEIFFVFRHFIRPPLKNQFFFLKLRHFHTYEAQPPNYFSCYGGGLIL